MERVVQPRRDVPLGVSGAIVALALVAQGSDFGEGFRIFALVILPVVLFIGLTTLVRLGIANYHDGLTVIGMNRIRAAYFERVPEVRRYFVMPGTDDDPAVWRAMGMDPSVPSAADAARLRTDARHRRQRGRRGGDRGDRRPPGRGRYRHRCGHRRRRVPCDLSLQGWFGAREATRERPDFAPMFPPEPD